MSDDRDLQFEVAQTILRGADQHGFVLAGSGAIGEHGIVDRLTRDVDLFTNRYDAAEFDRAVTEASTVLADAGYVVEERRRAEYFAHLNVTATDGRQVDVDFAYDWRGAEPARLQVGPVLSVDDAVASKTNAVYTRLEAVLHYAAILAQTGGGDVIDIPTSDDHGLSAYASVVLGPGIPVMATNAPEDDLEDDDRDFVDELTSRVAIAMSSPSHR